MPGPGETERHVTRMDPRAYGEARLQLCPRVFRDARVSSGMLEPVTVRERERHMGMLQRPASALRAPHCLPRASYSLLRMPQPPSEVGGHPDVVAVGAGSAAAAVGLRARWQ